MYRHMGVCNGESIAIQIWKVLTKKRRGGYVFMCCVVCVGAPNQIIWRKHLNKY